MSIRAGPGLGCVVCGVDLLPESVGVGLGLGSRWAGLDPGSSQVDRLPRNTGVGLANGSVGEGLVTRSVGPSLEPGSIRDELVLG